MNLGKAIQSSLFGRHGFRYRKGIRVLIILF